MKNSLGACPCGAYGEGAQHTQACRDGKVVIRHFALGSITRAITGVERTRPIEGQK